ncbi:MAG: TraQ conjugal transfer family protein, partial [Rikenellaceae bacterium]
MKQIFLALVAIIAISCDKQESVEPTLDFALDTRPTSNTITAGQTIEIACELHKSYFYSDNAEFMLQYEQLEGFGSLSMEGKRLSEGKSYTIPKGEFTLHYTAQG